MESDITVLMGKNEAGKTNILEALAKSRYFDREDKKFFYDPLPDYPRRRKKILDNQETAPLAVTAAYQVSELLLEQIQKEMLLEAKGSGFSRITDYRGKTEKFFQNPHGWANPLNEYVYRTYLLPNTPKFMYYDECYMLPSRISLDRLQKEEELTPQERTAKAFLMLADIDVDQVVRGGCFENYKSELETAQSRLNEELLKYWSANRNLRIEFEIVREETPRVQPEKKRRLFLFGKNNT